MQLNQKIVIWHLAFWSILGILAILTQMAQAQEQQPAAEIIALMGNAEIKPRADAKFRPAQLQDKLYPRDQIRTLEKSKVKLWFRDETILILGEKTLLDLAEYQLDGAGRRHKGYLKLLGGKMRFIVHKFFESAGLDIEGKTATLGVRGTDGIIESLDQDQIYLLDAKKPLLVTNKSTKERLELAPMNFARVELGRPMTTGIITPAMLKSLTSEYQVSATVTPPDLAAPPRLPSAYAQGFMLGNPAIPQDTPRNIYSFTDTVRGPLPTIHQQMRKP